MFHFNNNSREIEITHYNTPTPWMNYLSNGVFHTMISQAGGGVAFYKSPQIWRINHYRFSIYRWIGVVFIHILRMKVRYGVLQVSHVR